MIGYKFSFVSWLLSYYCIFYENPDHWYLPDAFPLGVCALNWRHFCVRCIISNDSCNFSPVPVTRICFEIGSSNYDLFWRDETGSGFDVKSLKGHLPETNTGFHSDSENDSQPEAGTGFDPDWSATTCDLKQHYSGVIMSAVASQITSLTIVYSTVYSDADQRNIKAPCHWPLWGEFTGDRWIPPTKSQ